MDSALIILYVLISITVTVVNTNFALKSFKKRKRGSFFLGLTSLFSGIVCAVCCGSVFVSTKGLFVILSTSYYVGVDFMLISLLGFSVTINRKETTIASMIISFMSMSLTLLDIIHLFINVSTGETKGLIEHPDTWPRFEYDIHLLYKYHLVFTYSLVFISIFCLFIKSRKVPSEYRGSYKYAIISIIAAIFINAVFLFADGSSFVKRVDVSTLTYGVGIAFIYWSFYKYSTSGMLKIFKTSVFNNTDKAIILFDYERKLMLYNHSSDILIPESAFRKDITLEEFVKENKIRVDIESDSNHSIQTCFERDGSVVHVRCDYKIIRNKEKEIVCYLFMFNDAADETDILTGFHNWERFKSFARTNRQQFSENVQVAVIDINALAVYNNTFGRDEGDRKIRELSDMMRNYFPDNTYFVRGHDAHLIAVINNVNEEFMRERADKIKNDYNLSVQYALNSLSDEYDDIIDVISDAEKAMKTKKLQDMNSTHSEILDTLVKALEECDSDTKNHVQRTGIIGEKLGIRLGLSDIQLSNLSLLCLLHDIGKIGIPNHILNKPGKLTDEEWIVMKTHTEKGYQIASSSKELSVIADMILHHHERWDGQGYPDGLSKESIPLLSRMISVIDSYDAMVNDRVYRPAMTREEAIAEMKKCAGTQFDPGIVTEFITMISENGFNKSIDLSAGSADSFSIIRDRGDKDVEEEKIENVSPVVYSRYTVDDELVIIDADEEFENITGYSNTEAVERKLTQSDLIPEADRTQYFYLVNEQLAKRPSAYFEHRLQKKDGDCVQVLCLGTEFINPETKKINTNIYISNIMHTQAVKIMVNQEQNKAQKRLKQWESQYRSDPLTGLMNRIAYRNDVEAKLISNNYRVLMIMLDIDMFKQYNDKFGHRKGDDLLVFIGHTLSGILRDKDFACRMGGDEFSAAMIFKNDIDEEIIYARAKQVYDKLTSAVFSSMNFSGLSMGAVVSNDGLNTFDKLYSESDRLLYIAKKNGRNRIICGESQKVKKG